MLHYRSGAKWVGALKRCLSVTATRDAFPISPVLPPVGGSALVNGNHDGEGEDVGGSATSASDMSEVEMDRMDGLPPSSSSSSGRARSESVGSNASHTEPLFSPIPFIVRDENGMLTHHPNATANTGGASQGKEAGEEGGEGMVIDQIPDLELGGADRTQDMSEVCRRRWLMLLPPVPLRPWQKRRSRMRVKRNRRRKERQT